MTVKGNNTMEILTLGLFCAGLILCIFLKFSILYALGAGLVLFWMYGRWKGFSWKSLFTISLAGIMTAKNILLTFLLIGVMTALWRAAGTIPVIVSFASTLIRPSILILMTFLLNCMVSMLTGTSFGTAATMGVICGAIGSSLGVDLRLVGGAVLSGAYFGDRCSPVSTSALLVAELTNTVVFDNIPRMMKSALVPFLLSCAVYLGLGFAAAPSGDVPDLTALFGREFSLHWAALLPAAVILVLSMMRVSVKPAMAASIAVAVPVCLLLQHTAPAEILRMAFTGYRAADPEVAAMLNGGGISSMLRVGGIVCISSSFSGIFRETGLLDGVRGEVEKLASRMGPYAAMLCTAAVSGIIACNQTLSIMLTSQLCWSLNKDKHRFALGLADTAVVVAPLVPWSIAGSVPLASVGAPLSGIWFACYLYLLPLWRLLRMKSL